MRLSYRGAKSFEPQTPSAWYARCVRVRRETRGSLGMCARAPLQISEASAVHHPTQHRSVSAGVGHPCCWFVTNSRTATHAFFRRRQKAEAAATRHHGLWTHGNIAGRRLAGAPPAPVVRESAQRRVANSASSSGANSRNVTNIASWRNCMTTAAWFHSSSMHTAPSVWRRLTLSARSVPLRRATVVLNWRTSAQWRSDGSPSLFSVGTAS